MCQNDCLTNTVQKNGKYGCRKDIRTITQRVNGKNGFIYSNMKQTNYITSILCSVE